MTALTPDQELIGIPGLPQETIDAAKLVLAVWRGVAPEYKSLYRKTIWDQLESAVRGSARVSPQLRLWLEHLKRRLSAQIVAGEDAETVVNILAQQHDAALLRTLREETATVVALVRVWQQDRRAAWQRQQSESA